MQITKIFWKQWKTMVVNNNFPFNEDKINENNNYQEFLRTFSFNLNNNELIWHLDKEDRLIKIIQTDNWFFQIENELPVKLLINDQILIKKETWHRLINNNAKIDLIINLIKYK